MGTKMYILASALIFTLAAAVHGVRTAFGWELIIADYSVPNWVSAVTFLLTAFLAYSGFRRLKQRQHPTDG